ncbi:hypothetical protein [Clostridium sp. DJ247]|nr:hypothetical protein [Clostridium sp. DJ247]MBC2579774.1 hypothetical protein [Clostridium sp. DJ247]
MESAIKEIIILYFKGYRIKDAINKVKSSVSSEELEGMVKKYERKI